MRHLTTRKIVPRSIIRNCLQRQSGTKTKIVILLSMIETLLGGEQPGKDPQPPQEQPPPHPQRSGQEAKQKSQ